MKKYKLIKQYPGSPALGTIIQGKGKQGWYTKGPGHTTYDWTQVVNYPKFWEEVIEKDYEILISRVVSQEILSVKRLSDGEVFTVGDLIDLKPVMSSELKQDRILKIRIVDNKIRFKMNFQADHSWGSSYTLNFLKKVKQPIFLTHDGKDIFEENTVWFVNKENFYYDYIIVSKETNFCSERRAYFLTRAAAENYLVQKSHSLSIEDFWEFDSWGGSNIAKSKRLKRLVKERLNIK
jgi:hypothetical protein